MLVRKIKEDWKPSENKSLQIGEIIDITNPEVLLKLGIVERADVQVKVEPMDVKVESIEFTCEKCGKECKNPQALKMHMRFCKE